MSSQAQNVFEAIVIFGHDEDFQPKIRGNWRPTDAVAGSAQKIEILRHRLEMGVPLFHPSDNPECICKTGGFHVMEPTIHVVKVRHHRVPMLSE